MALATEGGGMRGSVSAGMALALDELGLVPAFDALKAPRPGPSPGPGCSAGPPACTDGPSPPARGPSHVLVLRSRREPVIVPDGQAPARSVRFLARTTLRRESPALRAALLARDTRRAADDRFLAASAVTSQAGVPVAILSIRPPAGSPAVSRLATDGPLLRDAFESGRAAARAAFAS